MVWTVNTFLASLWLASPFTQPVAAVCTTTNVDVDVVFCFNLSFIVLALVSPHCKLFIVDRPPWGQREHPSVLAKKNRFVGNTNKEKKRNPRSRAVVRNLMMLKTHD